MPWEPQARHEMQRWELEHHIRHMWRTTTCIFLHFLSLIYSRKVSENLSSILKQSLIPSNVCVIIGTWLIGHSIIPRLDNYCDINLWNTIKCAFHLAAQMDWLLFNRSSKAFVKNDDLVRCTLWKLYWFITLVIFWKAEWEFSSLKSLKNRLTCYSWINMADYVT